MQFFRIYRPNDNKEVLFNVNQISKIEVRYVVTPEGSPTAIVQDLKSGVANELAVRSYKVFVAGEELNLIANGDDISQMLDNIYASSIKGGKGKKTNEE